MTPEDIIEQLKLLWEKADSVSDSWGYMWDDQLHELDHLTASFSVAYENYLEENPGEDLYEEHNTMNNAMQGTK